jgi:hypothetical protein
VGPQYGKQHELPIKQREITKKASNSEQYLAGEKILLVHTVSVRKNQ